MNRLPRGGFGTGFIVGLLIGLAVALAVALFINKTPVPFVNKLPQRTAEQDAAEAQRNRNWDPNAALTGKPAPRAGAASGPAIPAAVAPASRAETAPPAPAVVVPPAPTPAPALPPVAASRPARDPAALLSGQPSANAAPAVSFDYWVQVGAYNRAEDAEAQRARLGMLGQSAKVLEREQAGRTVYRVRIGPYEARDDAEALQAKLTAAGFESNLVRVER